MEILIIFGAALLGILVGGVLNVLADDLPMRRTPSRPHYPDGTPRAPSAWLGIIAFLTEGAHGVPSEIGRAHV